MLLPLLPPCVAAAYGAYWALVPTLVKDRFGTRALGTIMSILSIASAAGSYLLAKTVSAPCCFFRDCMCVRVDF